MQHLVTVGATPGAPKRLRDVAPGRPQCPGELRPGAARLSDLPQCGGRGPEEIALDAWLEDVGPYVSLAEVFGSVKALGRRTGADGARTRRVARMTATAAGGRHLRLIDA